jgi:hypothetical protein
MPEHDGTIVAMEDMPEGLEDFATDEKGRLLPENMSNRQLLIETVTVLRAVGDALAPMLSPEVARLGPIGMMRALMGGGG